jgi:hypothetical protein
MIMITEDDEDWKPQVGTLDDWKSLSTEKLSLPKTEVVFDNNMGSRIGDATYPGLIKINYDSEYFKNNPDGILYHEIGHQISNSNHEVQMSIILNYGNALGRYNVRRMYFDGVFGEMSPEEAFADAFSCYITNPSELKRRYPDTYSVMDFLYNRNQDVKKIVAGFKDSYDKATAEYNE